MTTPHYSTLIEVIHDEDLIRIRHRLRKVFDKEGPNQDVEFWINVLTEAFDAREEEHRARAKAVRQA